MVRSGVINAGGGSHVRVGTVGDFVVLVDGAGNWLLSLIPPTRLNIRKQIQVRLIELIKMLIHIIHFLPSLSTILTIPNRTTIIVTRRAVVALRVIVIVQMRKVRLLGHIVSRRVLGYFFSRVRTPSRLQRDFLGGIGPW